MKLDTQYSIPDLFRLSWSFLLTRLFFRKARIIRQPCRIRGFDYMEIGEGFTTGQFCRIEAGRPDGHKKTLNIGRDVQINDRCHIAALKSISIGDGVLIASNVFITDHDHGETSIESLTLAPAIRGLISSPVRIENNVWVGQNVSILKGVTIGESSVIAAGSVVTRDIPPFCVAGGVPARVLKQVTGETASKAS